MRDQKHTLTAAAIAALLACLSLITLAALSRPPFAANQFAILSGKQILSAVEVNEYISYLKRNLTVDSLYLLGHIGMWLGFATLIDKRGRRGSLIIVLGVISGASDFLENEIRWAIAVSPGGAMSESWAIVWQVTVGMSFWAMLMTTLLTITLLGIERRRDRILVLIGLGCLPGVCAIYYTGYLITFLWMIVWHGASACYLWQNAANGGLVVNHVEGGAIDNE